MLGCCNCPVICASLINRRTAFCEAADLSGRISLSAISRARSLSIAFQTMPSPPLPTSLIQVYRDFGWSSADWINVSTSTGPLDGQELSDCWMSESATSLMASQTSPRTTEFKVTRGSFWCFASLRSSSSSMNSRFFTVSQPRATSRSASGRDLFSAQARHADVSCVRSRNSLSNARTANNKFRSVTMRSLRKRCRTVESLQPETATLSGAKDCLTPASPTITFAGHDSQRRVGCRWWVADITLHNH